MEDKQEKQESRVMTSFLLDARLRTELRDYCRQRDLKIGRFLNRIIAAAIESKEEDHDA